MSKVTILYIAAAANLVAGAWVLVGSNGDFAAQEISTLAYVARGVGPLIVGATFIFLARRLRANEGYHDA